MKQYLRSSAALAVIFLAVSCSSLPATLKQSTPGEGETGKPGNVVKSEDGKQGVKTPFDQALEAYKKKATTYETARIKQEAATYARKQADADVIKLTNELTIATQKDDQAMQDFTKERSQANSEKADAAKRDKDHTTNLLNAAKTRVTTTQDVETAANLTFKTEKGAIDLEYEKLIVATQKVEGKPDDKIKPAFKTWDQISKASEEAKKSLNATVADLEKKETTWKEAVVAKQRAEDELTTRTKEHTEEKDENKKTVAQRLAAGAQTTFDNANDTEISAKEAVNSAINAKVEADAKIAELNHAISGFAPPAEGNKKLCGSAAEYGDPNKAIDILRKEISKTLSKEDQEECTAYLASNDKNDNLSIRMLGKPIKKKITIDIDAQKGKEYCIVTRKDSCHAFAIIHFSFDATATGEKEVEMEQSDFYVHNKDSWGDDYIPDSYPYNPSTPSADAN